MPTGGLASITSLDASFATQSVISDADYFFLHQIEGLTAQTSYVSTPGGAGWTGSLTGGGANITYSGDTSQYNTSGIITWTSSGSFSTDTWNAGGTAVFSDDTFTISESVSLGQSSADLTISGAITASLGVVQILDSDTNGNAEIRDLARSNPEEEDDVDCSLYELLGVTPKGHEVYATAWTLWGEDVEDDAAIVDRHGHIIEFTHWVPEPSAFIAWAGLGAMGLLMAWRRRKRAA